MKAVNRSRVFEDDREGVEDESPEQEPGSDALDEPCDNENGYYRPRHCTDTSMYLRSIRSSWRTSKDYYSTAYALTREEWLERCAVERQRESLFRDVKVCLEGRPKNPKHLK